MTGRVNKTDFLIDRFCHAAQESDKYGFKINLRAANQIGVTIPPNVLARADRVIK